LTAKQSNPQDPAFEENSNGNLAGSPEIQNHKNHQNRLVGSQPTASPEGWSYLQANAQKIKGQWVRFHLINEQVGGPGNTEYNLVPTTHAINTGAQWGKFEDDLKYFYDNNFWIWCKTVVTYDQSYPLGFPKGITGFAQYYDSSSRKWEKMKYSGTSLSLSPPNLGSTKPSFTLDEMTAPKWGLVFEGEKIKTGTIKMLNHLGSQYTDVNLFWGAVIDEVDLSDKQERMLDNAIRNTKDSKVNLSMSGF
jgi:hypothetical protein